MMDFKRALALVCALALGACSTWGREGPVEAPIINEPNLAEEARFNLPVEKLKSSGDVRDLSRDMVIQVLDEGPRGFIGGVDVEATFEGGRFLGWRLLSFFPDDPRFSNTLVREGDIVMGINGMTVERPDEVMPLWTSLRTAREIRIDLQREGVHRVMVYRIVD